MIEEEEEPRASTSRSPSPTSPVGPRQHLKSKRRHANLSVSDIRLAKIALVHADTDFTQQNPDLLSSPRPAPLPPVSANSSPEPSPDPFSLRFSDGSLRFPRPPIPTPSALTFDHYRTGSESPTPSMSSCSSSTSPETQSSGLPATPSSSDDEFPSYYYSPTPAFNPRRVTIKPLVITKHNTRAALRDSIGSSPSKLTNDYSLPSPLPSREDDSDSESDNEWYSREFSKILTLSSPLPPNLPTHGRPDSICITDNNRMPPSMPPTPSTPSHGFPSSQLDPAFPRRRRSRVSIPSYPPPPVPTSAKRASVTPSPMKTSRRRSNFLTVTPPSRRPPPRSSIPADCILVDDTFTFSDDGASAFSLSMYDDSPTSARPTVSPQSAYSQQSFQSAQPSPFPSSFPSTPSSAFPSSIDEEFDFPVEEFEFDLEDRPMMLPLDLPTSPLDLEADLTSRFEQLRNEPHPQAFGISNADAFSTGEHSPLPRRPSAGDDSRELRSRWSSSTLGSVREEHARRSGLGPTLRSYFGSPSAKPKRSASSRLSGSEIPKTPLTPTSPARRIRHAKRESDVMAIGYRYPAPAHGLKRRGSTSPSVSDAGSEESASSTASSGLRRKPIPTTYASPPSPSFTQSTSISTSTASTSPPLPTTPPRSSRSTRYPDLGRVPLHRRGTSKTYERLEDLLKEAGYKETRVFTPEGERAEASSVTSSSDHQGRVRNSVGAFVGFLAGLMPAASRSTSSLGTNVEPYSPPVSPLAQRTAQKSTYRPEDTSSSEMTSSLESLEPTPRPARVRPPSRASIPHASSIYSRSHSSQQDLRPRLAHPAPASSIYSQSHASQQDLRPRLPHRVSDQYSSASSRLPHHPPNSPLPTAGPSYQHIAQPRPSRAGAYLRHMASAPNMPKRSAQTPRRTLLHDDNDSDAQRKENGKPPLPGSWIESVARAVLFGGMGAYIGGPPAIEHPTQAQAIAAQHKTLRPTRSSLSQVSTKNTERRPLRSGLSDQTNTSMKRKAGGELMLAPPQLFTRIEKGRAETSAGEVSHTRVVCRSAPASRSGSVVRGGSDETRETRKKDRKERRESKNGKSRTRGRTVERRLPSLANTQTEGDRWVKVGKRAKPEAAGRNRYLRGWGMDGDSSDEGEDGRSSSSEEEGELDLARMLVNPKRQNSIVSLRKHLKDEKNGASGKPRTSSMMRTGRGVSSGAPQGNRSGSVRQRIVEDQDWDGSEAEDWGQGWVRKSAKNVQSGDDDDDGSFAGFFGEDRTGKDGGRMLGSGRKGTGGSRLGIPGKWGVIGGGS
ncbi:hypothetical protein DXG01_007549 [Tephrocybe rancida]|nr:hypothetical protein DXG01_007549 [Tephrocybe rancida]